MMKFILCLVFLGPFILLGGFVVWKRLRRPKRNKTIF